MVAISEGSAMLSFSTVGIEVTSVGNYTTEPIPVIISLMASRLRPLALLLFLYTIRLYAAPCEMNPSGPAQLVFAQVDAHQAWTEFKSIESVPKLVPGEGVSAEV